MLCFMSTHHFFLLALCVSPKDDPWQPSGVAYFHIPGTGGTNMEWALSKYACDHGLRMAPEYKGCTSCTAETAEFSRAWGRAAAGSYDVISAHMPLHLLSSIVNNSNRRVIRATNMREPVSAALKLMRGWAVGERYGILPFEADFQYRWLMHGNSWGHLWKDAWLTVHDALRFIDQHFDFFGMTAAYLNDYNDFYIRLSRIATHGQSESLLYRDTHVSSLCGPNASHTAYRENTTLQQAAGPDIRETRKRVLKRLHSRCIEGLPIHSREGCQLLHPEIMYNETIVFQQALLSLPADDLDRFNNLPFPADFALALAARQRHESPVSLASQTSYQEALNTWQAVSGVQAVCCSKACSHVWRAQRCLTQPLSGTSR